ncbi:MAG TPA: AAA domain-containing protein, partial [Mycobacteriales bacterium]|nr:AAA domain-containing protein [Mycobacteriales bacterium]
VVTDASFLLERLAATLGQVLDQDVESDVAADLDLDMVARVLGLAPIRSAAGDVPADVADTLNEEQCAAVSLALGSDVTHVWGPPGTGKTTTVAHVVAAHYRAGRSVLVVSNTNTAVDTALGRVADLLADDPGFDDGAVLRHRAIVNDDLREKHGDRLSAAAVVQRTAAPRLAERVRVEIELGALPGGDEHVADRRALRDRLDTLDRELATTEDAVLVRARVLGATVYQTWLGGMPDRDFDVVVVDEASMVMLPMAAYVAGLARHSVVIAGDFRQLSSIVVTRDGVARRWLATDAFTEVGIPRALAAGESPAHLAPLRTQYRMRPLIAEVVSELYYSDNPLRTGRDDRVAATGRALPTEAPLVYVDTGPLGAWAGYWGRGSRFNPLHALVVAELVEALAPAGILSDQGNADSSLGVVTPYAAQERLVAALLGDRHGRDARGWSSTVHRFQGNEKDAIVVDLADATGVVPGPGARARGADDAESRLLNVAISRARDCLVVVADFGYLRRRTPRSSVVRRLLELLEAEGAPLAPVLGSDGLGRLRWPGEEDRAMPVPHLLSVHDSSSARRSVEEDLTRAADEIVLWSPRVDGHGMAQWSAPLRAAVGRGVPVRVVTRPPAEQPGAARVIEQMRDAGVVVDLWAALDEQVLLVDAAYVWHGPALGLELREDGIWTRARSTALVSALVGVMRPAGAPRRQLGVSTNSPCAQCAAPTVLKRSAGSAVLRCTAGCDGE